MSQARAAPRPRRVEVSDGQRIIAWIERHCYIPEGRFVGQKVKLRPWQRDIVKQIYDTPTRRAIISFGRKNAKTTLAALLLLVHLVGPKGKLKPNSQLYSAAQSREQAALLFNLAAKIVRFSPTLRDHVVIRDTVKQLFCPTLGTLYRALSAEASTSYGLSPAFVVHDELGQVKGPRSELYEALETAAGAQEDPLSIVISTQAPTSADLLSVLIDDAEKGEDARTKLFLYTAPEALDPFSDEALRAANPAYGDFLNADEVRSQAEDARRMPARENAYRNLILNQRINAHSPFVSRAVWEECSEPSCEALFHERSTRRTVYAGLDLSGRNDLTALVLVAQDDDGVWHVHPEFWCPELGLEERARRDRAPYDLWVRQGHLHATPGASVDFAFVAQRLADIAQGCGRLCVAFDRWRMDFLTSELQRLGVMFSVHAKLDQTDPPSSDLALVRHGQGFLDMSPSLDVLESELLNKRLYHGGHPVLTWCAANAVAERNAVGERKLEKAKSSGRIDGLVALAMAIRAALTYAGQVEQYATGRLVVM